MDYTKGCIKCGSMDKSKLINIDGMKVVCSYCADMHGIKTMPDLNIEAGKFYLTRGGYKAKVLEIIGDKAIGYYEMLGNVSVWMWQRNGYGYGHSDGRDLVSPWFDPPVVDWYKFPKHIVAVAMDKNGIWWWYTQIPTQKYDEFNCDDGCSTHSYFPCGEILVNDRPNFTGDWRDSLAIRPGREEDK